MKRQETRMYGPNKFKLGLFGLNCSGGLTMTKAPEYWDASFENNLKAARLADEAGLEFLLPIGRWHGYGGETDTAGESFETLTWASGLLAGTKDICIFGTVHVSLLSPIFAAKQMVTAHHIGEGRFGLNIVSGWNVGEHEMHGVQIREHDERYDYSEEWVTIVKRIWSEGRAVRLQGQVFRPQGRRAQTQALRWRPALADQRRQFIGGPGLCRAPCRLSIHLGAGTRRIVG